MKHHAMTRRIAVYVMGILGVVLMGVGPAYCGLISNKVAANVAVDAAGRVAVDNEISNQGNVPVVNVTVTNFLGNDAFQSDVLGKNVPGGILRSQCLFETAIPKPGSYMVVSRVNFTEENGTSHVAYHFAPFTYGGGKSGPDDALTVRVETAEINLKSPLGAKGVLRLVFKNGQKIPVDPVVFLAMPEGLQIEKGEERVHLGPGEEQTVKIPVTAATGLRGDVSFQMMVRYETDTTHYAKLVNATVRIEERPVLFKIFLIVAVGVLMVFCIGLFYFRRRTARTGASGQGSKK